MSSTAVRQDAVRCALAGIAASDPGDLVERDLTGHSFGPSVSLLAVGKAAARMAQSAVDVLGPYLRRGVVIAPDPCVIAGAPVVAYRGGHPVPTDEGVRGASAVVRLVESLSAEDAILCLISGGASSLMTLPARGLALDDVRGVTRLLLRAGATIEEMNCVRKHIDRLKGGRLTALAFPARVVALVLSDVVGDSLATIASGPTVPDPSTITDAISVLRSRGVWDETPKAVRDHLESGVDESPKPGDLRFSHAVSRVIGNNALAAEAARAQAESLGYTARVVTTAMTGEARDVGASIASAICAERDTARGPVALVFGGETTVTVTGSGLGGRNQELALGAALRLRGCDGVAVASVGTDGVDGPTDAAGAVADGTTLSRAGTAGLNARSFLHDNDSHAFWKQLGDLVFTGPTGTNVMDIVVALATPAHPTA